MRKMWKQSIVVLFAALALQGAFHCKKTNSKVESLPAATEEGKNTLGFLLNGEVWVPNMKCAYFSDPCAALNLNILHTYGGAALPIGISLGAGRVSNGDKSYLIVVSRGVSTPLTSYFSQTGNIFDSLDIKYLTGTLVRYTAAADRSGVFNITKLDLVNHIIAGNFSFTLSNGIDSLVIRDGRFDLKDGACICY